MALAKRLGRVIVTFDLDFAEIYHRRGRGGFGVIVLRLENQTVKSVNRALDRFFRFDAVATSLAAALVVVHEERSRIVHPR